MSRTRVPTSGTEGKKPELVQRFAEHRATPAMRSARAAAKDKVSSCLVQGGGGGEGWYEVDPSLSC